MDSLPSIPVAKIVSSVITTPFTHLHWLTQDLNQLVIILADGRFHERESLKAAVREVTSRPGVCVAFLALDSVQSGGSLLDMQTVSFQGGKPVFTKYLDAFPFPYYVLLRDVANLPRTLADLLRQWFELSAI